MDTVDILNESIWTLPREDCLHPEWWHSTDPQGTEIEVSELVGSFVRAIQPEYCVETGTNTGQTAWCIGRALEQNGHGELDTIEPDMTYAQIAFRRLGSMPVTIEQMKSEDFKPRMPIDFAWLDSLQHLRLAEFNRFREYLAPGAVVGFHDTGPHKGSLGMMVRQLPGVQTLQLNTPRGVTFLQVRE